jgi:hypothetical protein
MEAQMSDNVIILGAGASVDAGVPVLANFVDKMLEYGLKGKAGNRSLSDDDKNIFEQAMKVRKELDGYHGRAAFDDRNIEDILSILAFNLMSGEKEERNKLEWMTKAIARTIELSTIVKFDNQRTNEIQKVEGAEAYIDFWYNLFRKFSNQKDLPTIITFNYDLVLERSLFQLLINTYFKPYNEERFPYDGIILKYYYKALESFPYRVNHITYEHHVDSGIEHLGGTTIETCSEKELKKPAIIELLKLHGSINFPNRNSNENIKPMIPTDPVENAYILPPLPNKGLFGEEVGIWKVALERLRQAKNIVIVGYSLPQTDIYMQYFFKAGLGPNVNLNKITVFNPILFRNNFGVDPECKAMEERFGNCFSPQLRARIIFRSFDWPRTDEKLLGTFKHFVEAINNDSSQLFF